MSFYKIQFYFMLCSYLLFLSFVFYGLSYFFSKKITLILSVFSLIFTLIISLYSLVLISEVTQFIMNDYKFYNIDFFYKNYDYIFRIFYENFLNKTNIFSVIFYFLSSLTLFLFTSQFFSYEKYYNKNFIFLGFIFKILFSIVSLMFYPIFCFILFLRAQRKMGTIRKLVDGNEVIRSRFFAELRLRFEMAVRDQLGFFFYKNLRVPWNLEVLNLLIIGGMGSGKTVFLTPIMQQFFSRKNRSIILDNKMDYCSVFGEEEGVIILSPFDKRSPPWNIAEDLVTELEALEFVKVVIPEVEGPNSYFSLAAQDVCLGGIKYLQATKAFQWNMNDVLVVLESDELLSILKEYHPGALATLKDCGIDEETGKMTVGKTSAGVFSQIRANLKNFEILARAWPETKNGFSLRKWARGDDPSVIFVIVPYMQLYPSISGFFSCVALDLFISEILNLPDSKERRVGLFLDELGAIPRIKLLANATKLLRSKGGCLFIGIQEVGFINKKYASDGGTETILNGFSIKLIGRSETSEYSEYFVKTLGKNKYKKITRSRSSDIKGRGTVSTSEEIVVEDALTTGELQSIPPASAQNGAVFYLKISEIPVIFKLTWFIVPMKPKYKGNVEPTWLARPKKEFVFGLEKTAKTTSDYEEKLGKNLVEKIDEIDNNETKIIEVDLSQISFDKGQDN